MKKQFAAWCQRAGTRVVLGVAVVVAAGMPSAWAAPFGPANLVLYRYDGGVASGSAAGVSLIELAPDGRRVQVLPLASSGGDALTASDTRSEGLLGRSVDGRCLVVPGYGVTAGTAAVKAAATVAPRRVAWVGPDGAQAGGVTFGTSASAAFMTDSIRGAVSDDCTQVWATGAGSKTSQGLWYAPKGGNESAQVQLVATNAQGIQIAARQLYTAFAGGGTLNRIGAGLPTTKAGATATALAGLPASNIRGLALLKLGSGVEAVDTAYLANNGANSIDKYSYNGSSWVARGRLPLTGAHGLLALDTGGGQVALFVTGSDDTVYRVFDRAGPTGTLAGNLTRIASAEASQSPPERWFGLALSPEASPPPAVPDAPRAASAVPGANGFVAQWQAPAAGAPVAWYVLEVSADNFDSVVAEYLVPASGAALSQAVTGLDNGTYVFRVRAVNSRGGSANLVSGSGVTLQPPGVTGLVDQLALSGVVGDATDPGATQGLAFQVSDAQDAAAALTVRATSSNTAVVPASGLVVSQRDGAVTLRIVPVSAGYADISVTVTNSRNLSVTRTVRYAASRAGPATPDTRWHTGRSDASSGMLLSGGALVLVADDEAPGADASGQPLPGGNTLWAYAREVSGAPAALPAIDPALGLGAAGSCSLPGLTGLVGCKADGEADLEAGMRIGNQLYVTGSHSNNKNGNSRADRWRLFAADVTDGATPTLSVQGYYRWLREDLRNWDAANEHRLGLVASSNGGGIPESESLDGFSIEGLSSSPDDGAAWFGFRAPLVGAPGQPAPVANDAAGRRYALIVPVTNYAALATANEGGQRGSAQFGTPIRLDLGGRGIREIAKNAAGDYLIIAGPPGSATGVAPKDFRLYSWDGSVDARGVATHLRLRSPALAALNPTVTGCSPEGLMTWPANLAQGGVTELISDCGDAVFYGDGTAAKDLPFNEWKKFRTDRLTLDALASAVVTASVSDEEGLSATVAASQAGEFRWMVLPAAAPAPSLEQLLAGQDGVGQPAAVAGRLAVAAGAPAGFGAAALAPGQSYTLYGVVVAGETPGQLVSTPLQRLSLGGSAGAQALLSGEHGWVFAPVGDGPMNSGGWIAASGAPKSPPTLPQGYRFPFGLFDFVALQGEPGSLLTARLSLPSPVPEGAVLWKYGSTADNAQAHWYTLPLGADGQPGSYSLSADRRTLTLRIADGQLGDSAPGVGGMIVDPSGIGVPVDPGAGGSGPAGPVAVPTLSAWGLLALVAGIASLAGLAGRRRQRSGA